MDDDLKNLEDELKLLRPRVPTPELPARIASSLAAQEGSRVVRLPDRRRVWFARASMGAGMAALIAVAVLVVGKFRTDATTQVASNDRPNSHVSDEDLRVSEVYWDPEDVGVLTVDDRPPVRVVSYQKLTSVQWNDASGATTVEWMPKSVETAFIPLKSQYR